MLDLDNTAARKDYKIKDCFQVTLPEDWKVRDPISLTSHSANGELRISFIAVPLPVRKTIDQWVSEQQNHVTTSKDYPAKLEGSGSIQIGNRDAKWSLFSVDYDEKKNYFFIYFIYSDQYAYLIHCHGLYSNLEVDRKTIDEVIADFKMLK